MYMNTVAHVGKWALRNHLDRFCIMSGLPRRGHVPVIIVPTVAA